MLAGGCWIALRAPAYILGFSDQESTWSLCRVFEVSECSTGIVSGNNSRRRRFSIQEVGRESKRSGKGKFALKPVLNSAEYIGNSFALGNPAVRDGKLGGHEDGIFCANSERGSKSADRSYFVDYNVQGALPLNVQVSRHLTSAAHRHDERVQYSRDDLSILEPPILSAPGKERQWPSSSGGPPAVPGVGETSGKRLQEQRLEQRKHAAGNKDGEDWRSLSRALSTGQKFCTISNRDLMKIAELRFSADMQEGDVGNQVALLQRALFWLGYLSEQSHITGHFGTETKQALCDFQEAHGVHSNGLWGPLSKHALWHTISGEILHRVVDEKASKTADASHHKDFSEAEDTMQAWKNVISGKMPTGEWKVLSGIVLLAAGIFFALIKLRSTTNATPKIHSVKRRIVSSGGREDLTVLFQGDLSSNANSMPKEDHPMSMNGPTMSSLYAHAKPTSNTEMDSAYQLSPTRRRDIRINGGLSDMGVEAGAQRSTVNPVTPYRSQRKVTSAQPMASPKASISKSPIESLRKDRQPALQERPAGVLGQTSSVKHADRSEILPSKNSYMQGVGVPNQQRNTLGKQVKRQESNPSVQMRKISQKNGAEVDQQEDDELTIKKRIEELRKAIEAAEYNGQAAMHALAEERQRSLELEVKISRQREAAAALEEEVRILKESHDALLASLRKKLSTSSATQGTSSLLYQTFDSNNGPNSDAT